MIHVRRTWTCGQVGLPKTKASKGPVPLHPLLAEFMIRWKERTTYPKPTDWVFPSLRLKGKQPRVANMLVEDYLRPAAAKGRILSSHRDEHGRMVEDDPRRFGFHNLRHSLASVLVRIGTDAKNSSNPATAQRCQIDAPVLQPRRQPRSNECGREVLELRTVRAHKSGCPQNSHGLWAGIASNDLISRVGVGSRRLQNCVSPTAGLSRNVCLIASLG